MKYVSYLDIIPGRTDVDVKELSSLCQILQVHPGGTLARSPGTRCPGELWGAVVDPVQGYRVQQGCGALITAPNTRRSSADLRRQPVLTLLYGMADYS